MLPTLLASKKLYYRYPSSAGAFSCLSFLVSRTETAEQSLRGGEQGREFLIDERGGLCLSSYDF